MTDLTAPRLVRTWGLWAVLAGGLALGLVFWQIFAPASQPQPSIGAQIGEIAGEIRRSAWRSFFGLPAAAVPAQDTAPLSHVAALAAPGLGLLAILLSLGSALRRENWRLPACGVSLGAAAIVFHFVWWIALLVAGVILLVTIVENMGEIFGGGLFGG